MVKLDIKEEVFIRDKGRCVVTGAGTLERTPHHCFFKSEYFEDDRDEAWNLVCIGMRPHRYIHMAKDEIEARIGEAYDQDLKELALSRYKGKHKEKLTKAFKVKHGYTKRKTKKD